MNLNSDANHTLAIKILKTIAFIVLFGSDVYASLRFVIILLLQTRTKASIDLIGWKFVEIGTWQSIWLHLYTGHGDILAFIFVLLALISVVSPLTSAQPVLNTFTSDPLVPPREIDNPHNQGPSPSLRSKLRTFHDGMMEKGNDLENQLKIKKEENIELLIENKRLLISLLDEQIKIKRLQLKNEELVNKLKSFSFASQIKKMNQNPETQQKNIQVKLVPSQSPSILSETLFNQNDFIVLNDDLRNLTNKQIILNEKFESKFQQLSNYNERNYQEIREEIVINKNYIENIIEKLNEQKEIRNVINKEIREEIRIIKKNMEENLEELNKEKVKISKVKKVNDEGKVIVEKFDQVQTQDLPNEKSQNESIMNNIEPKALSATLKACDKQEKDNWKTVQHRRLKTYQTRLIIDSAASYNIVNNREIFTDFKSHSHKIELANGTSFESLGIGTIELKLPYGDISFLKTHYVPDLKFNILSMATFLRNGYHVIPINRNKFIIKNRSHNIIIHGTYENGQLEVYQLNKRKS